MAKKRHKWMIQMRDDAVPQVWFLKWPDGWLFTADKKEATRWDRKKDAIEQARSLTDGNVPVIVVRV